MDRRNERFDTQLDCKLTSGKKNQTQLALVSYTQNRKQNRTKQEWWWKISHEQNVHHRPSSEQLRAFPNVLSDALSGRPHQSLQPSFRALSTRAISVFRWIRLSFLDKTLALNSLFSHCNMKNLACFYEPKFGWIPLITSLSDSVLETKNFRQKELNSTCELFKFVNYCGMWTLMVWNFRQL